MDLRNIAIIAHVDHGKTTLVDALLRQSGAVRDNQRIAERAMDTGDLERERGITILAKCTSIEWQNTRINIVDTPGHADFGGEVERILSMVDGCIVLVDAAEGPLPQTKFVVAKALARGIRPIVAINKLDRPDERHGEVLDMVFDLFVALDATDAQLDFPILYGAARDGWMATEPAGPKENMAPLLNLVTKHVPPPAIETGSFRMLATTLEADPYLGRVLTGRIAAGTVQPGMQVKALSHIGSTVETARISKILAFRALQRQPIELGEAGDIVALAGFDQATVADTLCAIDVARPIAADPVDPPTLTMTFRINDGPFAGQEGDKVQSRVIRDRLLHEVEGNVALRVTETNDKDAFEVSGRGELQLGVLIETMRREGFELTVSRPRVVLRTNPDTGAKQEPIEEIIIDVDEEHSGAVVQGMAERRGELTEMRASGGGRQRLVFLAPTRGLIGYNSQLMTDTRGTGLMNRLFHGYADHKGPIRGRGRGVLISNSQGEAVAFALFNLEERGPMIIVPQTRVYQGMIVGEHTRGNDLDVNVLKGKKLTNMRASGKDEAVSLTPPMKLPLEKAISYINDDELVEITPKSIRLRKRYLDPNDRKRSMRAQAAQDVPAG